jgi:hypothetical protein
MLAILRKPICIWRLNVIEMWKSRNINKRCFESCQLGTFLPRNTCLPKVTRFGGGWVWSKVLSELKFMNINQSLQLMIRTSSVSAIEMPYLTLIPSWSTNSTSYHGHSCFLASC